MPEEFRGTGFLYQKAREFAKCISPPGACSGANVPCQEIDRVVGCFRCVTLRGDGFPCREVFTMAHALRGGHPIRAAKQSKQGRVVSLLSVPQFKTVQPACQHVRHMLHSGVCNTDRALYVANESYDDMQFVCKLC